MAKQPTETDNQSRTEPSNRGLTMLDADLAVLASPWLLRARLMIAVILGCVFGGMGLFIVLGVAVAVAVQAHEPIGGLAGMGAVGVVCMLLAALVSRAGWATFKGYRLRGLL